MQLKVQYFAIFRDQVGSGEETIETRASTLDELFEELCRRHPGLQRFEHMKVAVNDRLVSWDSALADGDAILLFPPVAGG